MEPFEVSYKITGRSRQRSRSVTCVLCPTVIAQKLCFAEPIFVEVGNVSVDWSAPVSQAYRALFDEEMIEETNYHFRKAKLFNV